VPGGRPPTMVVRTASRSWGLSLRFRSELADFSLTETTPKPIGLCGEHTAQSADNQKQPSCQTDRFTLC
jgi:hypothetical protein